MSTKILGKFGVEISAPCNRQVQFRLTLDTLRGRYDSAVNSGMGASEGMGALQRAFPIIRGECIEVDTIKRQARIFDPYAKGESEADKWERMAPLVSGVPVVGKLNMAPQNKTTTKELDADRLKEWMYEVRNLIDTNKAVELTGKGYSEWPSMEAIKAMPGKVRKNHYSSHLDGEVKYQFEVPVTAGA